MTPTPPDPDRSNANDVLEQAPVVYARAATPPALRPATTAERVEMVDALRGFALAGVFLANVAHMSMPMLVAQQPALRVSPGWLDATVSWLMTWLVEGKFYLLFSFLFGMGMCMQAQRADARGARFAGVFGMRLLVLLIIGVAHGSLIWAGDILSTYALLGWVLLALRRAPDRWLLFIAGALVSASLIACGAGALLDQEIPEMQKLIAQAESAYVDPSWREVTRQRVADYVWTLVHTIAAYPHILAMFALGMWAARRGVLRDPLAHAPLLQRIAVLGLPLGLLLNAVAATAATRTDSGGPAVLIYWVSYAVGGPLLTFGYAAGFALLWIQATPRRALGLLAPTGRMALTNYLTQSLLCTTLFYGYGLGWFGKLTFAQGVALAVLVYPMQIAVSHAWLRGFRFGPAEWLWRSLTYAQPQPMLRREAPRR